MPGGHVAATAGYGVAAARSRSPTSRSRRASRTRMVCRLLPLACLAPDIVEAVLAGRQRKGLRLAEMSGNGPLAWRRSVRTGFRCRAGARKASVCELVRTDPRAGDRRTAAGSHRPRSSVQRVLDLLDQPGNIIERKPRPEIAQSAGRYPEGLRPSGGAPARQPAAQRLVDDLAQGATGATRFRLELGRDIVVQGERGARVGCYGIGIIMSKPRLVTLNLECGDAAGLGRA
jgi:hypothetical protein